LGVEIQEVKESLVAARDRGIRTRFITEVTASNIGYCKQLIQLVDELHHLDGIKGNFYINDKEYLAPAIFHDKGKPASEMIYSNAKELIEHQQYIFETLWNRSIHIQEKIKEIEKGVEPETFEVITDAQKATQILLSLAKSVEHEALFLLPADKAMRRCEKLGVIDYLIKASQNGAIVKIMCPLSEENSDIVSRISKNAPNIRILNSQTHTTSGFLIVDRTRFLRAELKNPDAKEFSEATGFTLYSNRKLSTDSFVSIFEILWKQTEMYEDSQSQLHTAEDELANMKQYLNEVLEEVGSMRSKQIQ
jgi:hypothetical protein